MSGKAGSGRHRRWTIALSLVPLPFLVFISSSTDLYLKNQAELNFQLAVLAPFVNLFLCTWAFGLVLYLLRSNLLFRYLLWGYFLGAPFVVAYKFLLGIVEHHRALSYYGLGWFVDSNVSPVIWLGAIAVTTVLAGRKADPRMAVKLMALFAIGLIVAGGFDMARGLSSERESQAPPRMSIAPRSGARDRPNIYHLVLDGFQTEIFERLRSPEIVDSLGGFVYFLDNRAIYHGTLLSLASMFSSSRYEYDRRVEDYIDYGYNRWSFVSELERAGYEITALVPSRGRFHTEIYRHVIQHDDNFQRDVAMNGAFFRRLWLYSTLPPNTRRQLMARGWLSEQTKRDFNRFAAGRVLAESAPVTSYLSFKEFIGNEGLRRDTGRYSFVHLLLPHDPYMLRSDCSYEGERMTDPLPQTRCTVGLLVELSDRLNELDRFEDSLIVVHGDHGEPFRLKNDALVRTRARSLRTPLLIKPPGAKRTAGLRVQTGTATLLDVAPTILELLELSSERELLGASQRQALEQSRSRSLR